MDYYRCKYELGGVDKGITYHLPFGPTLLNQQEFFLLKAQSSGGHTGMLSPANALANGDHTGILKWNARGAMAVKINAVFGQLWFFFAKATCC